jgi:hypothetical protein
MINYVVYPLKKCFFALALRALQEFWCRGSSSVKYSTMLLTQLLTSFTATGIITLVITHLHVDSILWLMWGYHWIIAWPIAFAVTRWIGPIYAKIFS